MPPLIDLKGSVFGKLIVRCRGEDATRPSGQRVPRWWCLCNCGNMIPVLVEGGDLRRANGTVSCGCHAGNIAGHKNITHGQSKTAEYSTWLGIHRRCYDPKERFFKSYGGRGIKVCSRWHRSNPDGLQNFIQDMGIRPLHFSIERLDVNGNYEANNCKWIPNEDQSKNKTTSKKLTYNGVTMIQSDWAKKLGVRPSRIPYHLWRGRTFHETVEFFLNKKAGSCQNTKKKI